MTTKITSRNYKIDVFKGMSVFIMLFIAGTAFTQTITNVFPTRVTIGSTVTIIGTGFDTNPAVSINGIATGVPDYVSATQIRFEIIQNTEFDPISEAGNISGILTVGDNDYLPQINYIAPKELELRHYSPFFVKEIYTNWDYLGDGGNFWSSRFYNEATSELERQAASPNNKHELLGYKINDIIYSTGVNDELLEEKLVFHRFLLDETEIGDGTGPLYKRKVFKAYSTNGVHGLTRSENFIITGDMLDGINGPGTETEGDFPNLPGIRDNIKDLTILESIIDGKNGLELGTGVANFNSQINVQFYSGNGQPGGVDDEDTPDLLITQIAGSYGSTDIYHYSDDLGNVVGRPIKLKISEYGNTYGDENTELAQWKINLYTFIPGHPFATATPNGRATEFIEDRFRPLRMAAFKLEDFDIETPEEVDIINNINMSGGGQADMAFMAYNAESFDIKGPVAKTILTQYVCRVDGSSTVTFKIDVGENVGIEDNNNELSGIRAPLPLDASETLRYQLWRGGASVTGDMQNDPSILTIENVNINDLGIYQIRIENDQGTVIVPVELVEGGTPTMWNGTSWSSLPYTDVDLADRNLFFAEDYNSAILNIDLLEGCDCRVLGNKNVIIGAGKTLKLYGKIVVDKETPILNEAGDPSGLSTPAGTFTLENNASLVQIKKPRLSDKNDGDIIVKRNAEDLVKYDYVYWSSPVENGELSMIPGATQHVYEWNVGFPNPLNGTDGNWEKASGIMQTGKGYIKRVNGEEAIPSVFTGVPNNGDYTVEVKKSISPLTPTSDRNMNLLGNPYPSAINAETFLVENTDLEGYVQVWIHNQELFSSTAGNPYYGNFKYNYGNQYLTYNAIGSTPLIEPTFEGIIASGQGFFVQVMESATSPYNVSFTNYMRYDDLNVDGYDNDGFRRGIVPSADTVQTEKQLIWLSLVNENNMSSVALVGYAEGATNGKDRLYDARSGSGNMRIYSVLEDSDFLIQGRALPFEDSDKVPLGVEILKNGIYKIGIDHLKGSLMLNEEQGIYLEDTYNNVIHNLRSAPYSFTATAGDVKDRFVLRYTNKTLSVDDKQMSETFAYVKNDQLYVKASKNIESVVVYDLTGKKLMDYKLDGHSDAFNTQFQFSRGAYLTVIRLENSGTITKKVMN